MPPRASPLVIVQHGIGLGGAPGVFAAPLEPPIGCAVVCAWFGRRSEVAVDDQRHTGSLAFLRQRLRPGGVA